MRTCKASVHIAAGHILFLYEFLGDYLLLVVTMLMIGGRVRLEGWVHVKICVEICGVALCRPKAGVWTSVLSMIFLSQMSTLVLIY